MPQGYVVLVLHAHLPYVIGHGKWPHGSDWLCEATCETYVPLLNLLGRLSGEGSHAGFTVGITPVLSEMFASSEFPDIVEDYCVEKIAAAQQDSCAFAASGRMEEARLADRWREFYSDRLDDFKSVYGYDLLAAFRHFQDGGQIEIITSAATHAYLPLLDLDASVAAQISQGVATYRKHFHRKPTGLWLPECAYRPAGRTPGPQSGFIFRKGLEDFLVEEGLEYFFLDSHHVAGRKGIPGGRVYEDDGLRRLVPAGDALVGRQGQRDNTVASNSPSSPRRPDGTSIRSDLHSVHRISGVGSDGCAFFIRDPETSQQVWSAEWGYPGDPHYLEFHKKHSPGGLRYWRVTNREGDLGSKLLYNPEKAGERVQEHAHHFAALLNGKLEEHYSRAGRHGVVTLPFDAELFGHWWFEGMDWLYELVSAFDGNYAKIERASTVLRHVSPTCDSRPAEGSWGEGGGHLIWYNTETAWTWERIREAERHMVRAAQRGRGDDLMARILNLMARELFLLQSSDWQFLMSTRSAADYARSRFLSHWEAFDRLRSMADRHGAGGLITDDEVKYVAAVEKRDSLFEDISFEWFIESEKSAGDGRDSREGIKDGL
jgi:1,4-alpha-glucan branching enzyme